MNVVRRICSAPLILLAAACFGQQTGFVLGQRAPQDCADCIFSIRHRKMSATTMTVGQDPPKENAIMIMLTSQYDNVTDVAPVIERLVAGMTDVSINYVYNNTLKGASISNISSRNIIKLLNKRAVKLGSYVNRYSINHVQKSPPWGLDRIDQSSATGDGTYTYNATGRGVLVYVIDTGIKPSHFEFAGSRASCAHSTLPELPCKDGYGHGTHVAGTIGGTKYGVAKRAELIGVRVLDDDGYGWTDGVIAGIDWVTGQRKGGNRRPMVINMSLGGAREEIINIAANAAGQAGIVVVVSAGNSANDACEQSPASAEKVITVGATGIDDEIAYFSSMGQCVEIFAPGVDVESASIDCDTCSVKYSGTSMSSPHVAGVAALLLEKNPRWKPHQVLSALRTSALTGRITGMKIPSPNLLLNMAGL